MCLPLGSIARRGKAALFPPLGHCRTLRWDMLDDRGVRDENSHGNVIVSTCLEGNSGFSCALFHSSLSKETRIQIGRASTTYQLLVMLGNMKVSFWVVITRIKALLLTGDPSNSHFFPCHITSSLKAFLSQLISQIFTFEFECVQCFTWMRFTPSILLQAPQDESLTARAVLGAQRLPWPCHRRVPRQT